MRKAVLFLIVFLLLGSVSAVQLNPLAKLKEHTLEEKSVPEQLREGFNEKYGAIKITENPFWTGEKTIAEYTLTKNTEQCLINCEAEGKAILYEEGVLFDEVLLLDEKKSTTGGELRYYLEVIKEEEITVSDYETLCTGKKIFLDFENEEVEDCREVIKGTHKETRLEKSWKEYHGEPLPPGYYKWKIKSKKKPEEKVDFIPVKNGAQLNEWAWWNGSWSQRLSLTIDKDKVAGSSNLENFPVFVDLGDFPDIFFSHVNDDGSDIRITNGDEVTELPVEVVSINTTAKTGELYFKADNLSPTTNTSFYFYFGNTDAITYAPSDDYGRHNVWSDYDAVYHLGETGTGTTGEYLDSASHGLNGTGGGQNITTTPSKTTGLLGGAQNFSLGDYIDLPNSIFTAPGGGNFTISAITKTSYDFSSSNVAVYSDYGNGNVHFISLQVSTENKTFGFWRDGSGNVLSTTGTTSINDGEWKSLSVTRSSSTTQELYVNATIENSTSNGAMENIDVTAGRTPRIGKLSSDSPSSTFNRYVGLIDEVRVSRKYFDDNRTTTEFNNLFSPNTFYHTNSYEITVTPTFRDIATPFPESFWNGGQIQIISRDEPNFTLTSTTSVLQLEPGNYTAIFNGTGYDSNPQGSTNFTVGTANATITLNVTNGLLNISAHDAVTGSTLKNFSGSFSFVDSGGAFGWGYVTWYELAYGFTPYTLGVCNDFTFDYSKTFSSTNGYSEVQTNRFLPVAVPLDVFCDTGDKKVMNYTHFYGYEVYNISISAPGYQQRNYYVYREINASGLPYSNNVLDVSIPLDKVTTNYTIVFRDELPPRQIINYTNITLELISDGLTSRNYTTNTATDDQPGILQVEMPVGENIFRYSSPLHSTRTYYATITPGDEGLITLYLLNSSLSTEITATVYDEQPSPLPNAYIKLLRYDLPTNSYILREIVQANFEGKAVLHAELNNEFHKFIVEYEGEQVLTTTPSKIFSTTINLPVMLEDPFLQEYFHSQSITYTLTFNNETDNFRFDYNDATNQVSQGCLKVYTITAMAKTLYNQSCASTSAATILVGVANTTGTIYLAESTITSQGTTTFLNSKTQSFPDQINTGGLGYLLTIILTLTFLFIGYWNPSVAAILFPLPLLLASLAGIISLPLETSIALFVVGLVIAVMLGDKS